VNARARTPALAVLALLTGCGVSPNPIRLQPQPPPACRCTATQKCLADGSTCTELNYVDPVGALATCPAPVVAAGGVLGPDTDPGIRKPVGTPIVGAGETLIDLGVLPVGQVASFTVPPDTAAFTIVEQAADATVPETVGERLPNVAVPDLVLDPTGNVIYDDVNVPTPAQLADPAAANLLTFGPSGSPVTGTFTFPSTSRALRVVEAGGVAPGRWSFLVNDWSYECFRFPQLCVGLRGTDASTYRVHVILKTAGAGTKTVPARGTLDLAVHLLDAADPLSPDAVGISAADALTNARLQRFVQRLGDLLAAGGVCLGTATFYDAPDWARNTFATGVTASNSSPSGPLAQLSTLSAEPAGVTVPRLHLFLVSRILSSSTNGTSVVGIDGTIPGPGAVNGTVRSGAAVSMENILAEQQGAPGACGSPDLDIACGADFTAYVAAHEAGHFLGLWHVTEGTGADHDPMADTPRCVCSLCAAKPLDCGSSSFVLGQSTCNQGVEQCSGGRNLMFWLLGSRSLTKGILSPDQGQVMRTSPAVRHP